MDSKKCVSLVVMVISYAVLIILGFVSFEISSKGSPAICLFCIIGVVAITIVALRVAGDSTHVRARETNSTLELASSTVSYMREGLSQESAQAVCSMLLPAVSACSVAITDREHILGFAGADAENYPLGSEIRTYATVQTLADGIPRVLDTREAFGSALPGKYIRAGIIVPLVVNKDIVGTLKFYYTHPMKIDESQKAMSRGFAQLLSTQLSLAYLDQQTELATRMELKALQAQINPHFLFNTINTIAAYTRTEPEKARIMLREFAVYYRRLLENSEDMIPLSVEIEQTDRYLMFQRARFGEDAVEMKMRIEPELEDLPVPAFIIQPLVENAVGHGRRDDGSTLHITINVHHSGEDDVVISVEDDGVGISSDRLSGIVEGGSKTGMGIALKNVQARLKGFFGSLSKLSIESEEGVGTKVILVLDGAWDDGDDA